MAMYTELHGASSQEYENKDEDEDDNKEVNFFVLNGYQYRISEHDEDGVNSIKLCLLIKEDEQLINDHNKVIEEVDDDDDDDNGHSHKKKKIRTMIKQKKRHTLGTLDGKLVRRGINFDRDMDYISQETCQAIHYFDIMGKVGEKICSLLGNDKKIIKKANGKYLLYVEELRVEDKERGKDLSLHLMEALFYYFQDDFSLCMLFPGPSIYNNNNNDYNWNERDDDDDEEVKQKHREKNDKVIIKLGRHFARLGFRQIDKNGYWIVNKPILPPLNKSETAGLEVLLDYPTYFRIVKLDEKEKELRNIIESPCPSVSDIKQYIDNNDITIDMINKTCIFHYAVVCEYKDIMNYLIYLGIDINYVDDLGNSPLHLAVMHGLYEIGIQLLLSGANKNVYDIEGKLPKQLLQEKRALGKRFNRCFYIKKNKNSKETSYEEAFRNFLA